MKILVLLILLAQDKPSDKPLRGLAEKCGSEIPWIASLEEAQKLAKESKKPIAWWVPALQGSPMDRKRVLEKYMLAGPFMMPGVVDLLSKDFVPLRLEGNLSHREAYGLEPLEFIEPGFVFLTPDLKVIHKVDRITTFSEEWFVHLLNQILKKEGGRRPLLSPARQALADGKPDPSLFEKFEGDEARYFHGVALHLVGRDEEGRAEWKKIKEGRWAWKAAAELDRDGPFVRGFEIHESLPAETLRGLPTSTTLPAKKPDVARAVRFLLQMQRGSGAWDDSNYNFGGEDSLPNVYMAITALAALALREAGRPDEVKKALERAEKYMKDESHVAENDKDEILWAHAYRLLYFARTRDKEMMARLVKKLEKLQARDGVWAHEYPNYFVTATALHVLDEAKKAGAEVPDGMLKRGAAALKSNRSAKGFFPYDTATPEIRPKGDAARAPFCEFALLLSGLGTNATVAASIDESFKHHSLLEKVRKYDDHADVWHNGGFFFWYDQYGRALAAKAVRADGALAKQREIVLSIPEIDGGWVDSHELGRVYGTAMALLTLKLCEP